MQKRQIPRIVAPLCLTLAAPACGPTPEGAARSLCTAVFECREPSPYGDVDSCTELYTGLLERILEEDRPCGEAYVDYFACVGDTECASGSLECNELAKEVEAVCE